MYKRQEQKQAFGAFERLSNAAAKEGFGLGLAILRNIVSMLGGTIRLDSKKGKGLSLIHISIDEGAMDEKSGMNFSEYMALLSGNTDLLDKAKLEKRIASLEGRSYPESDEPVS